MYSAEYVDKYIADLKKQGMDLQSIAWKAALACVGWPYVYGARGQYCTPATRRERYNATPEEKKKDKENIKDRCKNFSGTSSCSGCQWYPDNCTTRCFDCRGFTYWILLAVYKWQLQGAGCTTQWNNDNNWKSKGKISDGMPKDTLVCLFYSKNGMEVTWEHTGFGFNDETVECATTVYHKVKRDKKWTHWAIPACVGGDVPVDRPTLRKGSTGDWVILCQQDLLTLGYDLSPYGADGKYGNKTVQAVKNFQTDYGIKPIDGICGQKTWNGLIEYAEKPSPTTKLYTVHIPHQTEQQYEALKTQYPDAYKTEE